MIVLLLNYHWIHAKLTEGFVIVFLLLFSDSVQKLQEFLGALGTCGVKLYIVIFVNFECLHVIFPVSARSRNTKFIFVYYFWNIMAQSIL